MTFDSKTVRKLYNDNVSTIPDKIDKTKTLEEQARKAFEMRNTFRDEARALMDDKTTARELARKFPSVTFEEMVKSKMSRKGLTREEALLDIIKTSSKTNEKVNKELGLGGD